MPSRLLRPVSAGYRGVWSTITSRYPIGTNVYESDWDLLIVLDAARVDALKQVKSEYEFIDSVGKITSIASTSHEWMAQTFKRAYLDKIRETAYVSANAFSKRVIEQRKLPGGAAPTRWDVVYPEDFLLLDNAWEQQPDHPYHHMLSEHLTDRAITVNREYEPPRQIVHYLQPHKPYIADAIQEKRELQEYEKHPFRTLKHGEKSRAFIWELYLKDLRRCLDSIRLLLSSVQAEKVVITADHGEAFGEWGLYGHATGNLHPVVKQVPWIETTATDTGEYEPEFGYTLTDEGRDVDEHLRDLGYKV